VRPMPDPYRVEQSVRRWGPMRTRPDGALREGRENRVLAGGTGIPLWAGYLPTHIGAEGQNRTAGTLMEHQRRVRVGAAWPWLPITETCLPSVTGERG
jgi:hypothetical protein